MRKAEMRKYETIIIFAPTLGEPEVAQGTEKFKTFLKNNGATDVSVDSWGKREISYVLQKKKHGTYVVFYYCSDSSELGDKINSTLRIEESVLKFQTHRIQEQMRKFKGRIQSDEEDEVRERKPSRAA